MLTHPPIRPAPAVRGYALLEVLIAIVILAVGLLGLAKLQASTRQLEMEAYQRAQAVVLLQDMVARMTANRKSVSCYAITTNNAAGAPSLGTGGVAPLACATGQGTALQQARAVADLADWHALLLGSAEQEGGDNVGAMIGARGCVSYVDASEHYLVTVAWQGLVKTGVPAGLNCGLGQYGDEEMRRAVSAVVLVPNLD